VWDRAVSVSLDIYANLLIWWIGFNHLLILIFRRNVIVKEELLI